MLPRLISVSLLVLSPLNPADRSDSDLTSLMESIHRDGLLSALTVRPHPDQPGHFEVVCGERRTRSLTALIQAGRLPGTYAAPCFVREGISNAEFVLLAAEENLAREAMTPLDELRAVAMAREAGASLEIIATRLGSTPLKIQRRVAVLERGSPELREAIRRSDVTLAQAAAIVAAPISLHAALLSRALEGAAPNALVSLGKKAGIPLSVARFDPEAYTAERFQDDLFGLLPPCFLDIDAFFALQAAWLTAEVARLNAQHGEGYAVTLRSSTVDWGALKLRADAGEHPSRRVFTLNPDTGEITEYGAAPLEARLPSAASAAPRSAGQSGAALLTRDKGVEKALSAAGAALPAESRKVMHREREAALRRAVASRSTGAGLRQAMALTLLALERSASGGVKAVALRLEGTSSGAFPAAPHSPLEHFSALLALPQAEFQARFTAAVACGLRDDPERGPDSLLEALGRSNQLGEAYYTLEASYLSPMTKELLLDFAGSLPLPVKVKRSDSKPALIAAILAQAPALRALNWMPPGFAPPQAPTEPSPPSPAIPSPSSPAPASAALTPLPPCAPLPTTPWTRSAGSGIQHAEPTTPPNAAQLSAGWPAAPATVPQAPPTPSAALDDESDGDAWFDQNPLPLSLTQGEAALSAAP